MKARTSVRQHIKRINGKRVRVKKHTRLLHQDLGYKQLKKKGVRLSPYGNIDGDSKANIFDCRPTNPHKQDTKKQRMYERIEKHGRNLNNIFHTGIEPITLCKALFRLENKAHRLTTMGCNGEIYGDAFEAEETKILNSVNKILHFREKGIPVFVNGDCRGYALKIKEDWTRANRDNKPIHSDWGGYGIIAPDFRED